MFCVFPHRNRGLDDTDLEEVPRIVAYRQQHLNFSGCVAYGSTSSIDWRGQHVASPLLIYVRVGVSCDAESSVPQLFAEFLINIVRGHP